MYLKASPLPPAPWSVFQSVDHRVITILDHSVVWMFEIVDRSELSHLASHTLHKSLHFTLSQNGIGVPFWLKLAQQRYWRIQMWICRSGSGIGAPLDCPNYGQDGAMLCQDAPCWPKMAQCCTREDPKMDSGMPHAATWEHLRTILGSPETISGPSWGKTGQLWVQ